MFVLAKLNCKKWFKEYETSLDNEYLFRNIETDDIIKLIDYMSPNINYYTYYKRKKANWYGIQLFKYFYKELIKRHTSNRLTKTEYKSVLKSTRNIFNNRPGSNVNDKYRACSWIFPDIDYVVKSLSQPQLISLYRANSWWGGDRAEKELKLRLKENRITQRKRLELTLELGN